MKTATGAQQEQITKAITEVSAVSPSVPENEFRETGFTNKNYGTGTQYNAQGENIAQGSARQYISGGGPMTFGDIITQNFHILLGPNGDEAQAYLSALFLTDPRDDRAKLISTKGARVDGTCQWIEGHVLYDSWLHSHSQLLWLSGGPGKGKTMLSIFLAEELEQTVGPSQNKLLLQYFCDNKDDKRNTAVAILRGLIYQLLQLRQQLFDQILPTFKIQKESLISFEPLWRIFESMICDPALETTYCVLDGLDECDEASLSVLLRRFAALLSPKTNGSTACHLKLLIVSRDLPDCIPESLSSFPRISLDPGADAEINDDIELFIKMKAKELSKRKQYPRELRVHVEDVFRQRAQGTFLWVGLVAQALEKYKATDVEKALDEFPPGLDQLYARILLQIESSRREVAAKILRWVVMAVRPLTLSELSIAMETSAGPSIVAFDYDRRIRDQVSYCGNLLKVKEDKVGLIHQSAKDYLLRRTYDLNPELEVFRVKDDVANLEIARRCLDYLHSGPLDDRKPELLQDADHLRAYPLLSYAALHWHEHARFLARSEDIFDLSIPFYHKKSPTRTAWVKAVWALDKFHGEASGSFPLLHLASYFGILPLAENLVLTKSWIQKMKRSYHLDERDGREMTALMWAVWNGHETVIRFLIEQGANIEAKQPSWGTPLAIAAHRRHEAIVRLLLENGADVEAKTKPYTGVIVPFDWEAKFDQLMGTVLMVAAGSGHEGNVRLLLEKGANIEARGMNQATALMSAAQCVGSGMVRLLLEKGANIEAQDLLHMTALIVAAQHGHEPTVRLLLEKGANIEAHDRIQRTALLLAAERGHEATVRLLLEKGANIEARNFWQATGLICAAGRGHAAVVRLLLENGAERDARDGNAKTALMMAEEGRQFQEGKTPPNDASGDLLVVEKRILEMQKRQFEATVQLLDDRRGNWVEDVFGVEESKVSMARTHDISLIDYHVSDLATFGDYLTQAVDAVFPRSQARYTKVHVLLLSWEQDNLGVIDEVLELQHVFRETFLYDTEEWKIPSLHSYKALRKRLNKYLDDFEDKETLLIVYYGGHGFMNDDRQCIWSWPVSNDSSTQSPESPVVQWSGLQETLEHAESDTLILLDCCAAASSVSGAGSGVTEVIAACGFETWAPGVGEHSFTRSLIDELKYWSRAQTLTVALLHNKVLSRIKYWKPRFGSTGEHEHRKTPIYIVLANEGKQRSIELRPLAPRISPLLEPAETPTHGAPSSSSHSSNETKMDIDEPSIISSQSSLEQVWPDNDFHNPKVLISLALEEDQWLHTDEWIGWLRSVPALVNHAHVDGVYRSKSTLLILSLSIAVWDLLPRSPAITFIAFVESQNMLQGVCPSAAHIETYDRKASVSIDSPVNEKSTEEMRLRIGASQKAEQRDCDILDDSQPNQASSSVLLENVAERARFDLRDHEGTVIKHEKSQSTTTTHDERDARPSPRVSRVESTHDGTNPISHGPTRLPSEVINAHNILVKAPPFPRSDSDLAADIQQYSHSSLTNLRGYTTIFLCDDSKAVHRSWTDIKDLVDVLISKIELSEPDVKYIIDYMHSRNRTTNISQSHILQMKVPHNSDMRYQFLCSYLDTFTMSLMSLSDAERRNSPGLNFIVFIDYMFIDYCDSLRELLVEILNSLDTLEFDADIFRIQFVRISRDQSTAKDVPHLIENWSAESHTGIMLGFSWYHPNMASDALLDDILFGTAIKDPLSRAMLHDSPSSLDLPNPRIKDRDISLASTYYANLAPQRHNGTLTRFLNIENRSPPSNVRYSSNPELQEEQSEKKQVHEKHLQEKRLQEQRLQEEQLQVERLREKQLQEKQSQEQRLQEEQLQIKRLREKKLQEQRNPAVDGLQTLEDLGRLHPKNCL